MKFETEYKNEIQRISPTEEQCERIRNGVMSRLAEEQPAPKKKPLKIKLAALSAASACAAAVLIIAIGSPRLTKSMSDKCNEALAPSMGADGNGFSDDHAFADAPNYAVSDIQSPSFSMSGTDSANQSSAAGGSSNLKTESMYQNSDTGIPGAVASGNPSVGDKLDTDPNAPYLNFSENESRCTVTINGERRTYRAAEPAELDYDENQVRSEIAGLGDGSLDTSALKEFGYNGLLQPAGSNLDIELFVQFDEDKMLVFTKNGKLYKYFSLI